MLRHTTRDDDAVDSVQGCGAHLNGNFRFPTQSFKIHSAHLVKFALRSFSRSSLWSAPSRKVDSNWHLLAKSRSGKHLLVSLTKNMFFSSCSLPIPGHQTKLKTQLYICYNLKYAILMHVPYGELWWHYTTDVLSQSIESQKTSTLRRLYYRVKGQSSSLLWGEGVRSHHCYEAIRAALIYKFHEARERASLHIMTL